MWEIRWKSAIPKPKQTNVFISYDKFITLGEHLERWFSVHLHLTHVKLHIKN